MTPTVGRIVHYYDEDGNGPFAAIVTSVSGRCCGLVVFPPELQAVPHVYAAVRQGLVDAATGEPGHGGVIASHWFWPPRVG